MAIRLLVTVGPDMGAGFELAPGETLILGRGEDCDIRLADARISRHHCQIEIAGGRAMLQDLGSTWGTLVNGQKVGTHALQPNDVITLSETQLRFEVAADAAAATWAPSAGSQEPKPESASASPPKPKPASPAAKAAADTAIVANAKQPPSPIALKAGSLESLVGQTLHRYKIEDILSRSKSGILFRALDTKHQRPIALKVLWPEFSQNEEDVQRFLRAIKTMVGIRQENLVRVYGAGKTGAFCWTACELLDADNLATLMDQAKDKRLPWKQVLQIAMHIARALQTAADHKIVHRNITPNNILIRRKDGRAKLGDLMLAKALEGGQAEKITRPGETVGELSFLAPEQLFGTGDLDPRADIYSLGATIYAALTGQPPITGSSLSETIRNIESAEPARPTELNPAIPKEFETIVLRMLAKDPAQRFSSAAELLAELEALALINGLIAPGSKKSSTPPPPKKTESSSEEVPPVVPALQPEDPLGLGNWSPPVEEQSVTARLNRTKSKPKSDKPADRKKQLIIGGSLGGAVLIVLATLGISGFFGGAGKDAQDPSIAKADGKTDSASKKNVAFNEADPLGDSEENPLPRPGKPMELKDLIQNVEPGVVRINVTTADGLEGNGSGFVVDKEGTLVTNYHVIEDVTTATVVFANGRRATIDGVWHTDPERDIAVLQLNTFGLTLKPLRLTNDIPPKGEAVLAFGAPLGLNFSATEGIVSGIRTGSELDDVGIEDHQGTWIQTTAPISPGNSGGPLVNHMGEVVGVNTMSFTFGQNLNFAISARDVKSAILDRSSSEPEPLSKLSQRTTLAEFGLGETDAEEAKPVPIEPETVAEIKRLKAQGQKPLKAYAQKVGPLYKDQQKAWKRQLLTAYEKHGKRNPRWDKLVRKVFEAGEKDKQELKDAAKAAVDARCSDPAVLMFCAVLFLPREQAWELAQQAAEELETSKYPPSIRYKLRMFYIAIQSQFPDERENIPDTLKQLHGDFMDTIRDPQLTELERRMTYADSKKQTGILFRERELDFLSELESAEGVDPWLREMLSGLAHHTLGWRARGSGYANSVSQEEWGIFYAKLAQAQAHWLKAWRMHPEYPEAATELLSVLMAANKSIAGEDERFWLERAVEAQFDYEPAYKAYLWASRPRWGGSHAGMLSFARECKATARFDTLVPWQFHHAVADVVSEMGEDWKKVYKQPGIADDYLEIIGHYREKAEDEAHRNFLDSQRACVLILADRTQEAKKIIDELGPRIDERGFETFEVEMEEMLDQIK